MKDMGVSNVLLGIKISKTSEGLVLSQSYYIEHVIEKSKCEIRSKKTLVDVSLYLAKIMAQTFLN